MGYRPGFERKIPLPGIHLRPDMQYKFIYGESAIRHTRLYISLFHFSISLTDCLPRMSAR